MDPHTRGSAAKKIDGRAVYGIVAKRKRTVPLYVLVSEEEAALIKEKMLQAGTTNFSLYARKMLIDGHIQGRAEADIDAPHR